MPSQALLPSLNFHVINNTDLLFKKNMQPNYMREKKV